MQHPSPSVWFFLKVLALACAVLPVRAADTAADLVVLNGKVLTVDPDFHQVSAVAIKDGVFAAIGSDEEIRKWVGAGTRTIDAGGRTVIPGLEESHVHATQVAKAEVLQPYTQLASIGEIQGWLRQQVKRARPGEWIRLPRVDVTRIRERRLPDRKDLDAAAPTQPVLYIWQYANRSIEILNSAALRAARITKETLPPPGGKIDLDGNGEPTGRLENCHVMMLKFAPGGYVSDEQYHDSLARLLRLYSEIGITSINERLADVPAFRTYQTLKAEGRLPVRVTVTLGIATDGSVAATEQAIRALPVKFRDGDNWVRIGPLKVVVDGGILYGTAFMREPFGPAAFSLYNISDPNSRGALVFSPEKLKNIIRTGHRLGWQMSTHVTGDAGVDAVLDAVEAANGDSPIAPMRFNLIHAYFPDDETAKRAARLGVCVDTQPVMYYKDGDALADALGAGRISHFMALGYWAKAGVKVAINADHMFGFDPDTSCNPYNPFLELQTAVSRRTERGQVFGADQKVTREQALRMMTIDAAWLSFDEKVKGSIEVGKLGDLAILTDDYLACPEDRMKDIRAYVTVVGGNVVYERSPAHL